MLALALAFAGAARAQVTTSGYFPAQTGEGVYTSLCQGCHMADAKGAVGAGVYPALAGDKRLVSGAYAAVLVLQGHKAMPPFGGNLTDAQIAAVVNYVRTHFGNAYKGDLTPAAVKALRDAGRKRSGKANSAG
jgi:mono/diheme cytochrome c family protein